MKRSLHLLIFFIFLLLFSSLSFTANAKITSDFTYTIECQSVYLTPDLNDNVTFYKWRIETSEETIITTNWINKTENKTHHSLLSFNTSYYIYLVYKNETIQKERGKEINTPSLNSCSETKNTSLLQKDETETIEQKEKETSDYQNLFDDVPEDIKKFFGNALVQIPLAIVLLTLFLTFLKKKKKKIVYVKTK